MLVEQVRDVGPRHPQRPRHRLAEVAARGRELGERVGAALVVATRGGHDPHRHAELGIQRLRAVRRIRRPLDAERREAVLVLRLVGLGQRGALLELIARERFVDEAVAADRRQHVLERHVGVVLADEVDAGRLEAQPGAIGEVAEVVELAGGVGRELRLALVVADLIVGDHRLHRGRERRRGRRHLVRAHEREPLDRAAAAADHRARRPDALPARGADPELIGLALERVVVVGRDALGLRGRRDPALGLLHDVRELVPEQLEAAARRGIVAAGRDVDVGALGVRERADRRRGRPLVDPHGAEVDAERLLHARAHRTRQRLPRAARLGQRALARHRLGGGRRRGSVAPGAPVALSAHDRRPTRIRPSSYKRCATRNLASSAIGVLTSVGVAVALVARRARSQAVAPSRRVCGLTCAARRDADRAPGRPATAIDRRAPAAILAASRRST